MVSLSIIESKDIIGIAQWSQYNGIHSQMDYAIRKGGWLDSYCCDPQNYCYAAKSDQLCVGFSLLISKGDREAEFRIAVNPDFIGSGYGGKIVKETLMIGFFVHKLKTISLIVRKNNPIAQQLYAKHGFKFCGETKENIQGQCIEFYIMKLYENHFKAGENLCPKH